MLIVTEKYRVAKLIAQSLGFAKFEFDHFSNAHGDVICFSSGHLFTRSHNEPEIYSWKTPQNFNQLPRVIHSIPHSFTIKIRGNDVSSFDMIDTITSFMRSHDLIVNAFDFDREGERAFYDLFNHANTEAHVYRMDLSKGLSRRLICEAFSNLLDGSDTKSRYYASSARDVSDFAYSMVTQVATFYARSGKLHPLLSGYNDAQSSVVSLGQVQTPTLALIAKHCREVEQYKIHSITSPTITCKIGRYKCEFDYDPTLSGTDEALLAQPTLSRNYCKTRQIQTNTISCVAIKTSVISVSAPPLLNTAGVQKAVKSLSPSETMKVMQELYLKGLISYPRSDSEELPKTHYSNGRLASLLESLSHNEGFSEKPEGLASLVRDVERGDTPNCVSDTHESAHSAIVPTDVTPPSDLTANEQLVYNTICEGFTAALAGDSEMLHVRMSVAFDMEQLGVVGESKSIFTMDRSFSLSATKFNTIKVGDSFSPDSIATTKKRRNVPQYYKLHELPMIMLENGLGTAATRHSAIDKLLSRFYIDLVPSEDEKLVVMTAKGQAVLDILPEQFKTPETRAQWERDLDVIERTTELSKALELRNAFVSRTYDQVQYLCGLFNSGQLSHYNSDTTPASQALIEQVIARAKMLNITIEPSDYVLKKDCHNFLLAHPQPYHTKQKYELAKSGVAIDHHTQKDAKIVTQHLSTDSSSVPPSQKQLTLAKKLAYSLNVKFPDSALKSAEKCSEFIELCESKRKPTAAQISQLKKLALQLHYAISPEILTSRSATRSLTHKLNKLKNTKNR
ncbi:DNA topoisomerase [Vibrio sp. Hal054]|uniref:DNA topoisomerase n=1 Tax=Vibrio sp. Hal054 TaxID=3035158 RepID=UPI00301E2443